MSFLEVHSLMEKKTQQLTMIQLSMWQVASGINQTKPPMMATSLWILSLKIQVGEEGLAKEIISKDWT